ncbi:hypothetical protein NFI96_024302, partial [Prochilodus magdalenae]
ERNVGTTEPNCVSMKTDRSMGDTPKFYSGGEGCSCVSMKTDRSMGDTPEFCSGGEGQSCVSIKTDWSMGDTPEFCSGGEGQSCVSIKTDWSMGDTPEFCNGGGGCSCVSVKTDWSMGDTPDLSRGGGKHSCVSMKTDWSMGDTPDLSRGGGKHSCVSMKTDWSMGDTPDLSRGGGKHSCVSMKTDWSMGDTPDLSSGGGKHSCVSMKTDWSMGDTPDLSSGGGKHSCVSMKTDWSMRDTPDFCIGEGGLRKSSAKPPRQINTLVQQKGHLQQTTTPTKHFYQAEICRVSKKHKVSMKNKYENLFEGVKIEENKTLLNQIYTQLYITKGQREIDYGKTITGVTAKGIRHKQQKKEKDKRGSNMPEIRSVLTKGIAGIGKTVSVQKFILDWAEGKANQDVALMFELPFRELNLIKDDPYSLHGLLCAFHPDLKDLDPKIYDQIKAVFIFDGLDENRIPLDFLQSEKVSDITMTSSVGVLMTNLIKGELLPSALIWITSRPAAANQIPPQYINRVTEIQGFNDKQKEEYFRKRINDEDQARRIISHIKTVRSLHIMCHIPVFCWISATVLQQVMKQGSTEIPRTLTEMYSHFLLTQTHMKNEKYEEKDERDPKNLLESNRTILLKLAELAFKQLMKGNVMFYEEDLRESRIDITDASVYSGIFTEIFREECGLYQRKVYCFVHLSFQEFLAAVYVFHCYQNKNMEALQVFIPSYRGWSEHDLLEELLMGAVNKAVESPNGHLDLFLRFLLGISLKSSERLRGLLIPTQSSSDKLIQYIKKLIKGEDKLFHISIERSINLFLCLSEINGQSLSMEIEQYLKSEKHLETKLSPGQCSALACMLLTSEEVLDELDLKKYNASEEGYRRLIPAVTSCRKAQLAGCNLTINSCKTLRCALQSTTISLKELNLSNNDLQDSGVEMLFLGLKNLQCTLELLRSVKEDRVVNGVECSHEI